MTSTPENPPEETSAPASTREPARRSVAQMRRDAATKAARWSRIGFVVLLALLWLIIMVSASYPSPPGTLFAFAMLSMVAILALLVALALPRVRQLVGRVAMYSGIALSVVALALVLSHAPKQLKFSTSASSFEQVVTTLGQPPAQVPVAEGQPVAWIGNCPANIGRHEILPNGCLLAPHGYVFYLKQSGIHEYAGYAYFAGDQPASDALPQLLHEHPNYDNPPNFVEVKPHWYAFAYTSR